MSKPKSKYPPPRRRWLRTLGLAIAGLLVFLGLFVAAFVFNPFEGSLPDVRDIVPRDVNFFVRKQRLAEDFREFPEPWFWADLDGVRGFAELQQGPLAQDLRRQGLPAALDNLRSQFEQVRADSGGTVDLLRDVLGRELVVAGYEQDYSKQPPQPLARPHWAVYTRVSWRIKAALGLLGLGIGQSQLQQAGVRIESAGDYLSLQTPGLPEPLFLKRHLDVVMLSNHKPLLEQSQRLIDGSRDEEPLGKMAAYTEGASKRLRRWGEANSIDDPNAVEFVVEPNAFDGFRRHAASWPNAANQDSMNERVLASFLNLKGWMQVTGSLMFADEVIATTGQVVLNAKQHTPFQGSFYRAERQPRRDWLDPFLKMVPESACAAAALRMPAGEFLRAMVDALEPAARDLLNDGMRRSTFRGETLAGIDDLIDRLKVAFLSRTGFVFRQNKPDLSRDPQTGELMVPVTARSPMPQVAWVFWLQPGTNKLVEDLVTMMRDQLGNFGFRKAWHLRVPFGGSTLAEPVTEFCNPLIPATGQIAMMVFTDFFVVSNSGPLIKDILRTRYRADGMRPITELEDFTAIERELPNELNGLVWLRGKHLVPVLDDYLRFAESDSELPDAEWLVENRPAAEEQVRRSRFARYPSKASMPPAMTEPGGEFDNAVRGHLNELWKQTKSSFNEADRAKMAQLRAMAAMLNTAYLQLELENNYIRFQGRLQGNLR